MYNKREPFGMYILGSFGIFFPVLVRCTKKNLAAQNLPAEEGGSRAAAGFPRRTRAAPPTTTSGPATPKRSVSAAS
jgi:hypothetical protein